MDVTEMMMEEEDMKCLNCGSEIESGENFCGNCGAKVIRDGETEEQETQKLAFFCENCKAEVSLDDEFCGNCGQKIDHGRRKDSGESADTFPKPAVQETHAQNAGAAYDAKRQLKTKSFWKYLLLGLVTFGIYAIYVMWHVTKDINTICDGDKKRSPNYLVVMLLGIVTLGIYTYYWYYVQGKRLYEVAPAYSVDNSKNGMFYLLWMLFLPSIGSVVSAYFLFKNLNACIDAYNKGIVNSGSRNVQRAATIQKVLFSIAIFLRCAIIVAVVIISILGVTDSNEASIDESEISLDEVQVHKFEADELGAIINSGKAEQYYDDIIYVHGWLSRDSENEGEYFLYNAEIDAPESDGVTFTFDTLEKSLGDKSEIIVTGTLGQTGDTVSSTVLVGAEVEVIEKVERIYLYGTVTDLYERGTAYNGKRVSITGPVEGVGDSVWIGDAFDENLWIRLGGEIWNIPYDAVTDWNNATVTGIFVIDGYGDAVIEVESVE